MVNCVGSTDDFSRWKPEGFESHLTIAELCREVNRSEDRIKRLEKEGRLPSPVRVKVGRLRVRLYSPDDVRKVKRHFANAKPGRPSGQDS